MDGDDLEAYIDRWSRAHGGYDVRSSRPTMAWLRLAHGLGAPLARRGVPATWVTATGGVGAVAVGGVAALGGRWALLAAALVVVVAVLDGIDGAVAELTGTSSAWGQVLDQLVDRIGDVAMIAGLWVLGAPGPLCTAAAVLTLLDESIRSSAGAAGMVEIGVVSLPERPARLVVGGFSLAAAGIVPPAAALIVTVGAALWTAMTLVATVQLVVNVRRRLHGQPRKVLDADPGE